MTDDLVKRLRDKYASPQDAVAAADRIEKLEAAIVTYSSTVAGAAICYNSSL